MRSLPSTSMRRTTPLRPSDRAVEDGEAAGVLLDLASEGVEEAGALVAGEGLPGGERGAGRPDGKIDFAGVCLRDDG